MKVLRSCREDFKFFGMSPPPQLDNSLINIRNSTILMISAIVAVLGIVFFSYEAENIAEYADSFGASWSTALSAMNISTFIYKVRHVFEFMEHVESTINKRLINPVSKAIYEKSNQQVEKYGNALIVFMKRVSIPCLICPKAIISFVTYFTTDFSNDAFELPFHIWFPFDWKNPVGYLIAFSVEYVGLFIIAGIGVHLLVFLSGSCWLMISMAHDLKCDLHTVANIEKPKAKLNDELSKFVEFHSDVMQLVRAFSNAYHINLTISLLWTVGFLCESLLLIQIELLQPTVNVFLLITLFMELVWSILTTFIVCEFGQQVNTAFQELNDLMDEFDWYTYPMEIQRILPTIMVAIQRRVIVQAFGNIVCLRLHFKKVMNIAFSYFMVLRRFIG